MHNILCTATPVTTSATNTPNNRTMTVNSTTSYVLTEKYSDIDDVKALAHILYAVIEELNISDRISPEYTKKLLSLIRK